MGGGGGGGVQEKNLKIKIVLKRCSLERTQYIFPLHIRFYGVGEKKRLQIF